jgi:hypothetical protein
MGTHWNGTPLKITFRDKYFRGKFWEGSLDLSRFLKYKYFKLQTKFTVQLSKYNSV